MDNNISTPAPKKSGYMMHVSLMRVLAMITVVMHHSLAYYVVWSRPVTDPAYVYGAEYPLAVLAMFLKQTNLPVFLLLSGFLYAYLLMVKGKYSDSRQFVWGKVKRLLVPYFFWALMLIWFFPLEHHNYGNLFISFCHLWFLLMLFEVSIIFHFTRRWWMKWKAWADWLALLLIFVGQYLFRLYAPGSSIVTQVLRPVVVFIPYFALGIVLQKRMVAWPRARWWVYALLAVVFATVLLCIISSVHIPMAGIVFTLCDGAFVVCLFFWAEHYCQNRPQMANVKWLRDMDACGMGIYILHHIFIEIVTHVDVVTDFLKLHYYIGPVLLFVTSLALAWSITHYMRRTPLKILFG